MISQANNNDKVVKYAGILAGALSFIVAFIIYFKTMAATLSFWDCGEFIACANTLGVPHPPGTPFFVIIGRFFIMLHMFANVAQRTNFMSVLGSALTVWICYLIVVRMAQRLPFVSQNGRLGQIGIRIGALSSALLLTFSSTFWFSAVETEIYGVTMAVMMLIVYLLIRWAEDKEKGLGDKKLILVTFLLFLSVGIHLTVFLLAPAMFLFFILVDSEKLKDPMFWISWAIFFSLAVPFYFMVGMAIPWVEDKSYWIWVVLMILGTIFTGYMTARHRASGGRVGRANYSLAFALFLAGVLGYSAHLYIPVRAAQHPSINENDPNNFERFESYVERKQYGQESMISRMFYRRAALSHQFGRYQNMGFGGYFWGQYTAINWTGSTDNGQGEGLALLLDYIIFAFGIFGTLAGLYYAFKKSRGHPMTLIFMIFILSSLMLILYLNFSDGTRPDPQNPGDVIPLEVRERDYFYTPAFVVFTTMIGVGMAAAMYLLGEKLKYTQGPRDSLFRYLGFSVAGLILLTMPLNSAFANYRTHDRSEDYAPADYAWNILQSCRPNAIIFTNGDNDTFPLWYLQEVERVRKDVRVVNLSLLNTDWYILQLKHQMGIKMYLDDDQIAWIPAARRGNIIYYRPAKKFMDTVRNQLRYLTAEQDPRSGQIIRVQDQMIEQIAIANISSVPIYFSSSVPTSNRWTLDNRLIRQGIVMLVDPDTTKPRLDLPVADSLVTKVYHYTGLDDINSYRDENNVGLTTTFPERFSELAEAYKTRGDTAMAISRLWMGIQKIPYYHQNYIDLEDLYDQTGNKAMADSVKAVGIKNLKLACDVWPGIILYHQFLGVFYYHNNMLPEAQEAYRIAYGIQPDNAIAFRLYRDLTARMGDMQKAQNLMIDWTRRHPEDLEIQNQLNRMR